MKRKTAWLEKRLYPIALLSAALSVGGYLLFAGQTHGLGFPLDDAWIHHTYARNLAKYGEWAFVPGQISGGSTSPAWTILLAIGHLLGIPPLFWSYVLGGLGLASLAVLSARWLRIRLKDGGWILLMTLILVIEWHMVWAAVSGMETLAASLIAVVVLSLLDEEPWQGWKLGVMLGVAIWLRPGMLLLLLPVAYVAVIRTSFNLREMIKGALPFGAGALPLMGAYLLFNYGVSGAVWPSTFYAKQAEYAILQGQPLLLRFAQQMLQPLIGAGILLVPGLLVTIWNSVKEKRMDRLAPMIWVLAYWASYAMRLPVTYQHGRYAMPTVPIVLILGVEGMARWADLESSVSRKRLFSRVWVIATLAGMLVFWVQGAMAFATDVAIIETEMVASARWIQQHTEEQALIAAHDIGALGYYGERDILDLAGLVSPEVIPFMRDERALGRFLDERQAQYLMTFPGWYPELSAGLQSVYISQGVYSPDAGGENMAVYRWP